jgi:hypothetical protein
MTTRISTTEAKALTGLKNHYQAFDALYDRLTRRTWTQHGRTYTPAGMTWHSADGPQSLYLTFTAPDGDSGVFHSRVKLSLSAALDCISGNFETVERA